jgi:hypothetical protein
MACLHKSKGEALESVVGKLKGLHGRLVERFGGPAKNKKEVGGSGVNNTYAQEKELY